MTCIRPAGRRGACSCGNQYAQILDRLDTVEQEASDAKTTAQTAANSASIQAANAAADAAQAASDAGDALTQATAAAASAAAAALDAADAAADLASINSTISSTLTTYLGTKVDKLTTTGSFAYTHTNATQGETALVDGTTSNTIPIRDANGRMQAADPASGATDKTLTTANWVSQTGDSAPNNLMHRFGNETVYDNKSYADHMLALESVQNVPAVIPRAAGTGWVKLYESTDTNHANAILAMLPRRATSNPGFGILAVGGHNNGTVICKWMAKDLVNANYLDKVMVTIESDVITVWGANVSATDNVNMRIVADVYNGSYMLTYSGFKAATDTAIYTMTTDGGGNIVGYTDSDSVTHTFVSYEVSS